MKHWLFILVASSLCAVAFVSCKDEEDPYPNVTTELADIYTDNAGTMRRLVLDGGQHYSVSNPQTGYAKRAIYRVLVGYSTADSTATLYSLSPVHILRDSTTTPRKDPTKVLSVWRTANHINLHLAPKTQGGHQYWGFILDSVTVGKCEQPIHHVYLSLYHNQGNDPASYTTDVYASLPLDSIQLRNEQDSLISIGRKAAITFRINSENGTTNYEL